MSWTLARNTLGHFHPALVHFPVALTLAGAGLEFWQASRKRGPSLTARVLVLLALLGSVAAIASGFSLFRPGDFLGRTLTAVSIHRSLGLATSFALFVTAAASGNPARGQPESMRLVGYRLAYGVSAALVGLTGHYGGWIVFGWGWIWTP